jgi:hypothetical protein
MAMLVLLSTLSITINKHFCADNLVDVAVFSELKSCCSDTTSKNADTEASSCCKNESDLLKGQDELSLNKTETLSGFQKDFVAVFAVVFGAPFMLETAKETYEEHYSPPPLIRTIYQLNEVFLI